MSTEFNKAIVRRFNEEFISRGDVAAADELLAENVLDHNATPGSPRGRDGVKQFFGWLKTAFPDLRTIVYDQTAEGDKVVTRKAFQATHQGEFAGISPTGKAVTIHLTDIVRISSGQIAEHWVVIDQLGLMQQLGVLPANS